jgi:hypothetical protein
MGRFMPNYITIVKANKITENHPDLKGFITIAEELKPGKYEVGLFAGRSKQGNLKHSGEIKPEWVKAPKPPHEVEQKEVGFDEDIIF